MSCSPRGRLDGREHLEMARCLPAARAGVAPLLCGRKCGAQWSELRVRRVRGCVWVAVGIRESSPRGDGASKDKLGVPYGVINKWWLLWK